MDFAVVSLEMRSLGDERIFPGDTIMRKCKNAEGIQSMTLWKLGWDHLKGTKDVLFPQCLCFSSLDSFEVHTGSCPWQGPTECAISLPP